MGDVSGLSDLESTVAFITGNGGGNETPLTAKNLNIGEIAFKAYGLTPERAAALQAAASLPWISVSRRTRLPPKRLVINFRANTDSSIEMGTKWGTSN